MKIKIMSVLTGIVNGGFLRVAPLFLYSYILSNNLDRAGGTDVALQGALGALVFVFIANAIMFIIIYKIRKRASLKTNVFLFTFIAWIMAAVMSDLLLWPSIIFNEEKNGENIVGAFTLLTGILNFIAITTSAIIAKLTTKYITK